MCNISGVFIFRRVGTNDSVSRHITSIVHRGSARGPLGWGYANIDIISAESDQEPHYYDGKLDISRHVVTTQFNTAITIASNRSKSSTFGNSPILQPLSGSNILIATDGLITNAAEIAEEYNIKAPPEADAFIASCAIEQDGLEAVRKFKGDFALAYANKTDYHTLYIAKTGRPLWLQLIRNLGSLFFASNKEFLQPSNNYMAQLGSGMTEIRDNTILVIKQDGGNITMQEERL